MLLGLTESWSGWRVVSAWEVKAKEASRPPVAGGPNGSVRSGPQPERDILEERPERWGVERR
jgi:hypothetical protein